MVNIISAKTGRKKSAVFNNKSELRVKCVNRIKTDEMLKYNSCTDKNISQQLQGEVNIITCSVSNGPNNNNNKNKNNKNMKSARMKVSGLIHEKCECVCVCVRVMEACWA